MRSTTKSPVFAPILGPRLASALDDLFGPGGWVPPKHLGNVLITMPNARTWRVPHKIWHSDFPADGDPHTLFAVKLWALFDDAVPGGGATPQLAGSHRLFARFVAGRDDLDYKRTKFAFLRSHPWLRALSSADDDPDRNDRFLGHVEDVDGLPARVIECTGSAGDVYVTHPWVFHSIAVNASDRPRMMRSAAVWAAPR
jgi:ectoine hydroxylase-related dioxygenase (phytanoyl-CoA dioxygenase family)